MSNTENSKGIISLDNVTKYYGDQIGIEDLTLDIQKGEIFGFLGQNGAGKTTTIRCILNILLPQQGSIEVNGKVVSRDNPEIREEIGYLPGELNIPANNSVRDFLTYIASLKQKPSNRMMEITKRFELPLDKKVGELSKGNKQKMGIVLAFMHDPELYILDEPTSGLDPLWQQELYDLIHEEQRRGKTIFFSSHNLDETQRLCDRVGIIREGKLVTIETVHDLAKKIPRKLTVLVRDLTDNDITIISKDIDIQAYSLDAGQLQISVANATQVSEILEKLNYFNSRIRDLSYPPASLEEYFMSKYRE